MNSYEKKYNKCNIFITNYKWLIVINLNFNLSLKLIFYSLITTSNNLLLKIFCKVMLKCCGHRFYCKKLTNWCDRNVWCLNNIINKCLNEFFLWLIISQFVKLVVFITLLHKKSVVNNNLKIMIEKKNEQWNGWKGTWWDDLVSEKIFFPTFLVI